MDRVKKIVKVIGIGICGIVAILVVFVVYNQIALKVEESKIIPNGVMVDVDDYQIHVYSEGVNEEIPTLVFLSGSGTTAPVYDFKPFYSRLSYEYQIAVVEKAGYGYSDHADVSRDIDTMVEEIRTALMGAGIKAPYILLPHSMSGLEAIYWQQQYPEEIVGIIGLDMATPKSYENFDFSEVNQSMMIGKIVASLGLIRIPGIYPLNTDMLTLTEIEQQRMLAYRNAVNFLFAREVQEVYNNSQIVAQGNLVTCPILLFVSNGKEIGEDWISAQENFALETGAEIVSFDCGHYLHYYISEEMVEIIKKFISNLE